MKRAILFFAAAALSALPASAELTEVEFQTTRGNFVLQVDAERAPVSAENFLQYVRDGFYNGLIFHRVIPGFVAQGGGFTTEMVQKPTRPPIQNESENGWKNERHTISMARTREPHSATSQFFLNLVDNVGLDPESARDGWGYAVFGKIIRGGDVVDKIGAAPTGDKPLPSGHVFKDVPVTPIVMTLVHILDDADAEGAEQ